MGAATGSRSSCCRSCRRFSVATRVVALVSVIFDMIFNAVSCFQVDCGALPRVRVVYHGFPHGFESFLSGVVGSRPWRVVVWAVQRAVVVDGRGARLALSVGRRARSRYYLGACRIGWRCARAARSRPGGARIGVSRRDAPDDALHAFCLHPGQLFYTAAYEYATRARLDVITSCAMPVVLVVGWSARFVPGFQANIEKPRVLKQRESSNI